jgi:hypothetical protein
MPNKAERNGLYTCPHFKHLGDMRKVAKNVFNIITIYDDNASKDFFG